MAERIQKRLATMGLGSRREIERWIKEGRIKVNGETAQLGQSISSKDTVHVSGKRVAITETEAEKKVLIYHKPDGQIVSRDDPEHDDNIFLHLPPPPKGSRWIAVGRLDINSQGALLVTNDGQLAHKLMHPSSELKRVYAVRVTGELTESQIQHLKRGVELEDGIAKFGQVDFIGGQGMNFWYHVSLKEGRNREIRRMFDALELQVSRLVRVSYGCIDLPKRLARGRSQELTPKELNKLYASVELLAPKVPGIPERRSDRSPDKGRGRAASGAGYGTAGSYGGGRAIRSDVNVFRRKK